jgi:hypothetical protein
MPALRVVNQVVGLQHDGLDQGLSCVVAEQRHFGSGFVGSALHEGPVCSVSVVSRLMAVAR